MNKPDIIWFEIPSMRTLVFNEIVRSNIQCLYSYGINVNCHTNNFILNEL